eukprot:1707846-Pyramimonas_sp.AAC.2
MCGQELIHVADDHREEREHSGGQEGVRGYGVTKCLDSVRPLFGRYDVLGPTIAAPRANSAYGSQGMERSFSNASSGIEDARIFGHIALALLVGRLRRISRVRTVVQL